jgi:methionine-rich copper-binding protein CopC
MHMLWRLVITRPFLLGAAAAVSCLAFVFPATVCAHTVLLRSDPASDAILRPATVQVRLWFSAAVDPAFSTAIVENGAHEYVNDCDAQLSPGDASEMDVHLRPHLPPGVYAVVWRAVSDDRDGRIISGSFLFAVARTDGTVPGQPSRDGLLQTGLSPGQFNTFAFFSLVLIPLVSLGIVFWVGASLWLLLMRLPARAYGAGQGLASQQDHHRFEQRVAFMRKKHLRRLRRFLGWGSVLGVGMVVCLGLVQEWGGSRWATNAVSTPALRLQQSSMEPLSAFHAALRTTDQRYTIILDVTNAASGPSVFALSVGDPVTGKPIVDVDVSILTTMLDMSMGTDTLKGHAEGKGRFSAQIDLSTSGLWQIGIQLRTPDHRLHEAAVKMLTSS